MPFALRPDTPRDYALSAALWGAGLGWLVPMMGLQMALYRVAEPQQAAVARAPVHARPGRAHRLALARGGRPGDRSERARTSFFQNHVNHLDHCTMYCATPHFKQGVELEEHFRYPIYGRYMRSRGTIPVRRGDAAQLRQLITRMRDELARGHSLLVFPEGTRTLTGQLGEFQPGVFRIVQQLGAPIVPVTVTGMYRVMRKGSYLIRPGYDVTVYCDAPIETRGAHSPRRSGADGAGSDRDGRSA